MGEGQPIPSVYPALIKGERVHLREVAADDSDAVWGWGSRTEFFQFLPIDQPTQAEERAWLESVIAEAQRAPRRQYQLGIEAADSNALVGMVRLGIDSDRHRGASIGYGVNPDYWGRGYATDAARLIVEFGFETLGMHRIWATHHPDNQASRRVLEKIGMREEGRRRDDRLLDGVWFDSVVCSILESEWRLSRSLTRNTRTATIPRGLSDLDG